MTVRKFLSMWVDNVSFKIYQVPIAKINKSKDLVLRQVGSIDTLINSNQNYLDFEIQNFQYDDGMIIIVCKANEEQERRIIEGHRKDR